MARRNGNGAKLGFRKFATLDDIRQKMKRLTTELRRQTAEAAKPHKDIWANLEDIGYGR